MRDPPAGLASLGPADLAARDEHMF